MPQNFRTRQDVNKAIFRFEVCRQLSGRALRHVVYRKLLNTQYTPHDNIDLRVSSLTKPLITEHYNLILQLYQSTLLHYVYNNNNNNNNRNDIYGAVIMTKPLREFARFMSWEDD